jgi:hypothetical protein
MSGRGRGGRGYVGNNYNPNFSNRGRGGPPQKMTWNANAKPFQPAAVRAALQVNTNSERIERKRMELK